MVVTIELKPETEARLSKRAAAQGYDVAEYVQRLLDEEAHAPKTFDEILAPFRQEVTQSGLDDDALDELFTDARRKAFQTRQQRKKK